MAGENEDTFISEGALFPPGHYAGPADSLHIIAKGGPAVQQCIAVTGEEKFEHMLLYCLTLLSQAAPGDISAFYISDFDDCDEHTLRVIQQLIGRSGYATRDYNPEPEEVYTGFWAWRR